MIGLSPILIDKEEVLRLIDYLGLKVSSASPLAHLAKGKISKGFPEETSVSEELREVLKTIADPEKLYFFMIKMAGVMQNLTYYEKDSILVQYAIYEGEKHVVYDVTDPISLLEFLFSIFKRSEGKTESTNPLIFQEYIALCAALRLQEYSDLVGGIESESDRLQISLEDLMTEIKAILYRVYGGTSAWSQEDESVFVEAMNGLIEKGFLNLREGAFSVTEAWNRLTSITGAGSTSLTIWVKGLKRKEDRMARIMGNKDGIVSFEMCSDGVVLRELPSTDLRNYLSAFTFEVLIPPKTMS